jgi:LDH2 family malate/lactate/ureidoglycolate dehydrogenase
MIKSLKQTPTAPGFSEILMPGEVEFRAYEKRKREGIDIDKFTMHNLAAVAKDLNVQLS